MRLASGVLLRPQSAFQSASSPHRIVGTRLSVRRQRPLKEWSAPGGGSPASNNAARVKFLAEGGGVHRCCVTEWCLAFADEIQPMNHASRQLGSLLLACIVFAMPGAPAAQERAMVPVTIDGEQVKLATITYKPPGNGPFPTLIFHHGSTGPGRDPALFGWSHDPMALAGWFTARGWAVILPSRRGRGGSEGTYDEGFGPDRAQGYSCEPARALAGAERALRDIDAITPVLLAQPFVDRERVAIGGVSRGGILAVAWSGRQPGVARAVVNFVGGWLSERCASIDDVNADLFRRGSAFDRSTIWLYGYRDSYYSLRHSRSNFTAFRAAGGKGAFREFDPPAGLDGHQIAAISDLWTEALEAYLADHGLPAKPSPGGGDRRQHDQDGRHDLQALGNRRARARPAVLSARLAGRHRGSPRARRHDRAAPRHLRSQGPGRLRALGGPVPAGGQDLGAAMVVSGMALAVTADGGDYVEQEVQAMRARVGVHAHACLTPSEWRARQDSGIE